MTVLMHEKNFQTTLQEPIDNAIMLNHTALNFGFVLSDKSEVQFKFFYMQSFPRFCLSTSMAINTVKFGN